VRGRRVALLVLLLLIGVAGGWVFASLGNSDKADERPEGLHGKERHLRETNQRLERQLREAKEKEATGFVPPASSGRSHREGEGGPALAGKVIAVDPGHNGGNATHPEEISRLVPANAHGGTKPCNTTGTATNDGRLTEAEFNLDVAFDLRRDLQTRGAMVVMTRKTNGGVGPCVDRRAEIGNRAHAAAAISIHADGNESPGARGFHVIYAKTDEMVDPALEGSSRALATRVRDALVAAGAPISNYLGLNGLDARDDLAGLNLSRVPAVLVELGNMRSSVEAEQLERSAYRSQLAEAITEGVQQFLAGH
jgi:N-acetylmuramoyl-L-alanine amidase